jgi:hypothetical protein
MTWFKVDDRLHSSRKILSIPRSVRLSSVGLWTLAGSWSAHEELDGLVPDYMVTELGGTPRLVAALVTAGLWIEVNDGSQFNKWQEYQPTRAELELARSKETERKRLYRSRGTPAGVPAGQTEGHQQESEHPDPTRPDPTYYKTKRNALGGTTGAEPPLFCSRHEGNPSTTACTNCGDARRVHERWMRSQKPIELPTRSGIVTPDVCSDGYPLGECPYCDQAVAS